MSRRRFDPVTLAWGGKEYSIPADKMMRVIAVIEDVVTLAELKRYHDKGGAPLAKLSEAFAAALSFAGATGVTADEVYLAMFGTEEDQAQAATAVVGLLQIMAPPGSASGNAQAPAAEVRRSTGAESSSKKRGRR